MRRQVDVDDLEANAPTLSFDASLLLDSDLRLAISRYYNARERIANTEQDWDEQMMRFEASMLDLQPPLQRIATLRREEAIAAGLPIQTVSAEDLVEMIGAIRGRSDVRAALAQIYLIWMAAESFYTLHLDSASETLALVAAEVAD